MEDFKREMNELLTKHNVAIYLEESSDKNIGTPKAPDEVGFIDLDTDDIIAFNFNRLDDEPTIYNLV